MMRWGRRGKLSSKRRGSSGGRPGGARSGRTDQRHEQLEGLAHVGHDLDRRLVAGVDLGRREVDVDDLEPARLIPLGRPVFHWIVAHSDHEVRAREAEAGGIVRGQADGGLRERVIGRDGPLRHERGHHRHLRPLGERRQLLGRQAADDTVAGENQRTLRLIDDVRRARERGSIGRRPAGAVGGERLALGGLLRDVLGQLEMARPGLLFLGALERLAHGLGDHRARLDARVPLRERPEHVDDVDVLVRLLVEQVPGELARDRHDRRTVEVRIGQAGREVRGARPERGQAHARAAGQTTPDVRHEGRRLLVPDRNERDGRAGERVVDVQRLLAGHAEDVAHALALQAADQQLGSGHRYAIQTDLMLTNSRMPYSESSRP